MLEAAIDPGNILSVVSSTPPGSVKGWACAQVCIEGEKFCHESCGTFFAQEGAMKAHCMAIGAPYEHYGELIYNFCYRLGNAPPKQTLSSDAPSKSPPILQTCHFASIDKLTGWPFLGRSGGLVRDGNGR